MPPRHDLSENKTIRLKQLLDYPYIAREEGSGTREVIHEYVAEAGLKSVDIHVAKLRRKIELDPAEPQALVTVRGAGYRLLVADP